MRCLYCGKKLSLLHKISGKEFCGSEHYELYLQDQESLGLARLIEARQAARTRKRQPSKQTEDGAPPLAEVFFSLAAAPQDCRPEIRTCRTEPQLSVGVALPQPGMSLAPCRIPEPKTRLEIELPAAQVGGPRRVEAKFEVSAVRNRIPAVPSGMIQRPRGLPAPKWIPPALAAPAPPTVESGLPAAHLESDEIVAEPPAAGSSLPTAVRKTCPAAPLAVPSGPGEPKDATTPSIVPIRTGELEAPASAPRSAWTLAYGGWKLLERVTAGFVQPRLEITGLGPVPRPSAGNPVELRAPAPVFAATAPAIPGGDCRLPASSLLGSRFQESFAAGPGVPLPGPASLEQPPLTPPGTPPVPCRPTLPAADLQPTKLSAVPGPHRPLADRPHQEPAKAFLVPPSVSLRIESHLPLQALRPLLWRATGRIRPAASAPAAAPLSSGEPDAPRAAAARRFDLAESPSRRPALDVVQREPHRPRGAPPVPIRFAVSETAPPVPTGTLAPRFEFSAAAVPIHPGEMVQAAGAGPGAPSPRPAVFCGPADVDVALGPAAGPPPWAGRLSKLVPLSIGHIVPPAGDGIQSKLSEWPSKPPRPVLRRSNRVPVADEFTSRSTTPAPGPGRRPRILPWVVHNWRRLPGTVKLAVMILPLALLLAQQLQVREYPNEVAAAVSQEEGAFAKALKARWETLQTNIMNRAAISLTDDFRSGLGSWIGDGNWGRTWAYDEAGFVLPGALALYEPSLNLVDYEFVLAARIERGGVSWVFRAQDTRNYYAGRLVITDPGPLPKAKLINYTVVDGRRKSQKSTEVPFPLRDKMYRIRVTVRGSTFTTYLDDRVVGLYKDDTLKSGGVGLFRARGEKARVRWISVMHQYDLLGRLCALIAPYNLDRPRGGWSE